MKMKITTILILSLILLSNVYAQEQYQKLQQKVDSLEKKLEKINVQQVNPNSVVDTLDWGTGFFFGGKVGNYYTMNFELGYMFGLKKNLMGGWDRDYTGKRQGYRLGLSAGVQFFEDETVYKNCMTTYQSSGYGIYGKFNYGSPVLLNFISISGHFKVMYTKPAFDNDHSIEDGRIALGFGTDLEFWLTENACTTIGYTDEGDSFFDEHKNDSILPDRIRFTFGFKTFF